MSGEYLTLRTNAGVEYKMLNLVDFVFIIEHQTRGLFRGFDHAARSEIYGPRWMRGDRITRRSPEIWSTPDPKAAGEMMECVLKHHHDAYLVRMTRRTR